MAKDDFESIKTLTIIALVSDDDLMDKLVLKGGNALRLIHPMPVRQSLDLDFSLAEDFGPVDKVRSRIEALLQGTFEPKGYAVFDVSLTRAPDNVKEDTLGEFWGGYTLRFKVMEKNRYDRLDPKKRPLQAIELGPRGQRTFTVDISKHEHVEGKVRREVDGYTVYVYSGLMIACEKVRALCQQMPEYREIVKSTSRRPRARDFLDIYHLVEQAGVRLATDDGWTTLVKMFGAKRVPIHFIERISSERDYHREDFVSVKDTVDAGYPLRDFDFYVDFLVNHLQPLKARWEIEPPIR
jgi:predicted nucleotidyltransferase component of viral defense system